MVEKRRKGEENGKRLTPGERAINWAKATAAAWPVVLGLVGLLGWTNSDYIMRAVNIQEADGKTEVQPGGMTFEETVAKFTQEINARVDEIDGRIEVHKANLSADDRRNLVQLRKELKAVTMRLERVEELVQ